MDPDAIAEELAERAARALEMSAKDAVEYIKNFFKKIDRLDRNLDAIHRIQKKISWLEDCHFRMMLNYTWYNCLTRLYELTDKITTYPFNVEFDVAAGETKEQTIDLTSTDICCIGPIFQCATDIGGYNTLVLKINEEPVDKKIDKWKNKTRTYRMPDILASFSLVHIPKRKLKVMFTNSHPTETAHDMFMLECMLVKLDYALKYMTNIYDIMMLFFEKLWYEGVPE
ncbi:hypothetical protein DRP04_00800 [Archaeoglobales archaeon]|nr:MAG: hypothetical protein DRP04_00800 [Archaeoglobales archaeon]